MLVLKRKRNQRILIGQGPDAVEMTVSEICRGQVKLCFDGPSHIRISRTETLDENGNFNPTNPAPAPAPNPAPAPTSIPKKEKQQ
jgi:carbon storage regulator CsrA